MGVYSNLTKILGLFYISIYMSKKIRFKNLKKFWKVTPSTQFIAWLSPQGEENAYRRFMIFQAIILLGGTHQKGMIIPPAT